MARQVETREFNPFIVLSDVTMATLVVVCCLLMVHLHRVVRRYEDALAQAEIARKQADIAVQEKEALQRKLAKYDAQLEEIGKNKVALEEAITRMGGLGQRFPFAWSRGTTKVLFRICGYKEGNSRRLFDGATLTDEGRSACKDFATALAEPLRLQMYGSGKKIGYLSEIQIQGHCSSSSRGDLWRLSLGRALAVKECIASVSEFPSALITVSGAADARQAYLSTDDYVKKEASKSRRAWQSLSYPEFKEILQDLRLHVKKRDQLPDRIDITFVYGGEVSDDSLVPARDPVTRALLGPEIDTAIDRFDENAYPEQKYNDVFHPGGASPTPSPLPPP